MNLRNKTKVAVYLDVSAYCWSLEQLAEGMALLAQEAGYVAANVSVPVLPSNFAAESTDEWIESMALHFGIETQTAVTPYEEIDAFLQTAAPAICQISNDNKKPHFLLLLKKNHDNLVLLLPDGNHQKVPSTTVHSVLCEHLERPLLSEIESVLSAANVPERRKEKAKAAILKERLNGRYLTNCWLIEHAPGASFWQQLRHIDAPRYFLTFAGGHTVQYALWILSWALLGHAVFEDQVEIGWLYAWALLLLTVVLLRLLVLWSQNILAVSVNGLLQRRLLYGVMLLHPDEVRHEGAGQLMGRAFEAEEMERLALNGGLVGVLAIIELVLSAWVLSSGSSPILSVTLLFIWIVFSILLGLRFYSHRQRWTDKRRSLTHDLIERMVGHRTRVSQTSPQHWHDGEDKSMSEYINLSTASDKVEVSIRTWIPRGWLVIGICAIAPAFIANSSSPAALAITMGGVLSAHLAFLKLARSLSLLISATISWQQLAPLYHAASRPICTGDPETLAITPAREAINNTRLPNQPILNIYNLHFQYQNASTPQLADCDLIIRQNDQILLEGESGGGKSTLSALLTGMRRPQHGLIFLHGSDFNTLGQNGWRKQIAASPQFHENHILGSTVIFNLLMGRHWPPRPGEWQLAETICEELGLRSLLEKMPAGLLQPIGETGWQLSHGEKSRLYIARALLQEAAIVILDESFAALDPQNLAQTMACVQKRAKTLLIITHP